MRVSSVRWYEKLLHFSLDDMWVVAIFNAVNLGDDADTVGAIYGQLGGAYYGAESIPADWKQKCSLLSLIELFANELEQLSSSISIPSVPIPDSIDWSKINTPVPLDKCKLPLYLT